MKRGEFLKMIGLGAAAVVVAPLVVANVVAEKPVVGFIVAKARRKGMSYVNQMTILRNTIAVTGEGVNTVTWFGSEEIRGWAYQDNLDKMREFKMKEEQIKLWGK